MTIRFVCLTATLCVLGACVPVVKQPIDSQPSVEATEPATVKTASGSMYSLYKEGIIGNGQKSILFFYASWFPFCTENDLKLKALSASGQIINPVYRIDYDTATVLRLQYAVVTQDTFVVINGKGEKTRSIVHPDDSELRVLVGLPPVPPVLVP